LKTKKDRLPQRSLKFAVLNSRIAYTVKRLALLNHFDCG